MGTKDPLMPVLARERLLLIGHLAAVATILFWTVSYFAENSFLLVFMFGIFGLVTFCATVGLYGAVIWAWIEEAFDEPEPKD